MVIDMMRYKVRRRMQEWVVKGMRVSLIASGMAPEEADAYIAEAEEKFVKAEVEQKQDRISGHLESSLQVMYKDFNPSMVRRTHC